MDIHICSEIYTHFCEKWRGYKQPKTILLDNLDYDDIADFSVSRIANNFPITLYQLLPEVLTDDQHIILNANLENDKIPHIVLFTPVEIEIDNPKATVVVYDKMNGLSITEVFNKFSTSSTNVLLFDVVFLNSNDILNLVMLSHKEIGILCSKEIGKESIETPPNLLDIVAKPLPQVMHDYSGIVMLEKPETTFDIRISWYGGVNILLKRLYETKRLINISKILRSYCLKKVDEDRLNNYINSDEFSLIFSIPFEDDAYKNIPVKPIDGNSFVDSLTSDLTELENYTFKDLQKRRDYLSIGSSLKIFEIQNALISNFYRKYNHIYQAKVAAIDESLKDYEDQQRFEAKVLIDTQTNEIIKETQAKFAEKYQQEIKQKNEEMEAHFVKKAKDMEFDLEKVKRQLADDMKKQIAKNELEISDAAAFKSKELDNNYRNETRQYEKLLLDLKAKFEKERAMISTLYENENQALISAYEKQKKDIISTHEGEYQTILKNNKSEIERTVAQNREFLLKSIQDDNNDLEKKRIDFHNRELKRLNDIYEERQAVVNKSISELEALKIQEEERIKKEIQDTKDNVIKNLLKNISSNLM